jgi:hypothetical protein
MSHFHRPGMLSQSTNIVYFHRVNCLISTISFKYCLYGPRYNYKGLLMTSDGTLKSLHKSAHLQSKQ